MKNLIKILFLSCLYGIAESKFSLIYNNDLLPPKYPFDLKQIFSSLFHTKTLCIWTKTITDQRINDLLIEIHTFNDYSITYINYGKANISSLHCIDNIVFNMDYVDIQVLYKDEKPSIRHVFLTIDTMRSNVEEMKKLSVEPKFGVFKIFSIAKIILLTEYQVYKFSSPFFPPRYLQKVTTLKDLGDEKVTDLKGRVVNISTFNCSLFSILKGPMNSGLHDGIEMRMMQHLAIYLNMTPHYINAEGFGWMFDNGTWNGGLAGLLQDGKAEIGFCNIWNTVRYNQVVALGPQWIQLYYTFMVPRPVLIHGYWMTIVTLFHKAVWFLLLKMSCLVIVLFWKYKKCKLEGGLSDLFGSVLTMFGTFLGQTVPVPPCYAFGRRIVLSWSIFSFFMASVLNNTMISRLMFPHQSEKIDSVKDFVLGGYHWGEEAYSNFQQEIYFNIKDSWHKKMEAQFQPIPRHTMKAAMHSRRFAFPVQRLGNEYVFILQKSINQSEIGDFRLMREVVNQFYVSMVFSKLSPMLEICRDPILRFVETGLIIHWKREVISHYGSLKVAMLLVDPPGEELSEFEPLSIDNNLAAFKILLYGGCLSFVVLLVEIFIYQKNGMGKLKGKDKKRDEPFTPYFYCE